VLHRRGSPFAARRSPLAARGSPIADLGRLLYNGPQQFSKIPQAAPERHQSGTRAAPRDRPQTLKYVDNVAGRRWRLVELARLGGISEQQVRNYLAAGLLPPAPRAANNYRLFSDQHADAMRTARALATGHGWARTRAVLAAVHDGDVAAALAAIDDSHAELARERASIATATRAFTQAANDPAAVRPPARIGRVAADIGVRAPVLRLWERRGLLRPHRDPATGYRVYNAAEQRTAHLIVVLRAGRFTFPIIDAVIAAIRSSGSVSRALAELSRRDEQVHQLSRTRLLGSAALHGYLAAYYP
jgi:DNA-binding transcriptional MerR regulator